MAIAVVAVGAGGGGGVWTFAVWLSFRPGRVPGARFALGGAGVGLITSTLGIRQLNWQAATAEAMVVAADAGDGYFVG